MRSPIFEENGNHIYARDTANSVEYSLYLNHKLEWAIRAIDVDTQEWIVPIRIFPTAMAQQAEDYYDELFLRAIKARNL